MMRQMFAVDGPGGWREPAGAGCRANSAARCGGRPAARCGGRPASCCGGRPLPAADPARGPYPVGKPRRDSRKRVSGRLFDQVWDRHLVVSPEGEPPLLYIDLHLVHEVTSPQAFEGLELAGRAVRRPDLTVATMDHDVPTIGLDKPIADPLAAAQIARLRRNCAAHGLTLHVLGSS